MTTRAEHLAWCKQRALEYLDAGLNTEAVASMVSDLGKHEETRDHPGILLMGGLAMLGEFNDVRKTRRFIEGFN